MFSFLWPLIYVLASCFIISILLICYEYNMYHKIWPLPENYSDTIAVAKKKKDHEMNDHEFNLKYAPFRHEMGRLAHLNPQILRKLNIFLHYIELYLLNGGPNRLKKNYPIKKPIFIIGDFRSGTSVLERLIAHHPDITYWTMSHGVLWAAPYLWMKLLSILEFLRTLLGHKSWNKPYGKGIYWPHSSNILLTRDKPFEIELLWESCKYNLNYKRYINWKYLEHVTINPDNNSDIDILDHTMNDTQFEILFKNSIRLLLATNKSSKTPRLILKNPLNGYRIGYLYKMFPDAQFIHIARNPLKTTLSQIRMGESSLRCFMLNENQCRINPANIQSSVFNNRSPNDATGMLWFPRQFPRIKPAYHKITQYMKQGKYNCAVAVSVCQYERVVLDSFEKYKINISANNLLTIWHEDLLENASLTFKKVMAYLDLKCNKQQRLDWLEKEDFPNGQANKDRIKQSQKTETCIDFGKDTKEINAIIECSDAMKRYKNKT